MSVLKPEVIVIEPEYYCPFCLTKLTPDEKDEDYMYCWRDRVSIPKRECK